MEEKIVTITRHELCNQYLEECSMSFRQLIKTILDNYDDGTIAYGVAIGVAFKLGYLNIENED